MDVEREGEEGEERGRVREGGGGMEGGVCAYVLNLNCE